MTILSLSYLIFVMLVWLILRLARFPRVWQILLLAASYVFYGMWGLDFLAILITSSLVNFLLGRGLRRNPTTRRLWLAVGANILLLAIFKYFPSLSVSLLANSAFTMLVKNIVMPVGISFWTFNAIGYLFDIYQGGDDEPTLLEFGLFMAFWPTVLSGPISRMGDLLPQLRQVPKIAEEDLAAGTRRILIGLFMKVVLAQTLALGLQAGEGVADGFDKITGGWGGLDVWFLAIGFGFELYFDFAGYSHIVIGTARLFGIRLSENFERPYLSTTPAVFWTRWHMSLSFWIRDYVFMPLATRRRSLTWRNIMLLLSMTVFGLWHGATAPLIAWGVYHGVLLVAHRLGQQLQRRLGWIWPTNGLGTMLAWGVTFALVSLGWIFFRANDLSQALSMLAAVMSPSTYRTLVLRPNFYIVTSLVIVGCFVYYGLDYLIARWQNQRAFRVVLWLLSPACYTLMMVLIIVWSKQESLFVYFQF